MFKLPPPITVGVKIFGPLLNQIFNKAMTKSFCYTVLSHYNEIRYNVKF